MKLIPSVFYGAKIKLLYCEKCWKPVTSFKRIQKTNNKRGWLLQYGCGHLDLATNKQYLRVIITRQKNKRLLEEWRKKNENKRFDT